MQKNVAEKGKLILLDENKNPCASEMFSSGWCNLDCVYCYIPKGDFLLDIHKKIIEKIKKGLYIDELFDLYGEDLESMAHWGTEPTLTLDVFRKYKIYNKAVNVFPKLNKISFSSNFIKDPKVIVDFVKSLPITRKFTIDVQISLDGPAWITDASRRLGTTDIIKDHSIKFIKLMNEFSTIHQVRVHFKPTMPLSNIEKMCDYEILKEYYEFFDEIFHQMAISNTNNEVNILNGCDPTIVVPAEYTSSDGKYFCEMFKIQRELQRLQWNHVYPNCNYLYRYRRLVDFQKELYTKNHMFSCSAGDTSFGVREDGSICMCHRFYYLNWDEYYKAEKDDNDRELYGGHNIDSLKIANDKWTTTTESKKDIIRFLYKHRAFHDFNKQVISSIMAIIKQMVDCGQVSKAYQDDNLAIKLASFVSTQLCPAEQVINNGSMFIYDHNVIRLFGNGLFEEFEKVICEELYDI